MPPVRRRRCQAQDKREAMNTDFRLMPEQASSVAGEVDRLYAFLILVSGFFTLLIGVAILYLAIKYRRGSQANRERKKAHLLAIEVTWIAVPFALTMVMFFW